MILFDVEPLQNPDYKDRGIGRYVRNLLDGMRAQGADFQLIYNPNLPPPDCNRLAIPEQFIAASRKNFVGADPAWLVTLSPIERSLGFIPRLYRDSCPQGRVATLIHDLIPLVFESDYLSHPAERARYSVCLESALNSDLMLTNSNHTSSDVMRLLNPRAPVVTVGGGVEDVFFDGAAELGAGDEGLMAKFPRLRPDGFILTISGAHKSKNFRQLLDSYARCSGEFRLAFPLVVAGLNDEPAQYFQAEWKGMLKARRQTGDEVIFLPRVTDEQLRSLYSLAVCLFFPASMKATACRSQRRWFAARFVSAPTGRRCRKFCPTRSFSSIRNRART